MATKAKDITLDKLLVDRFKGGDQSAFDEMVSRYWDRIFSRVLQLLKNRQDAEEVTQEIFLKLWMKAGSFDLSKGSAFAWLMSIARRHAIDRTRSKRYKAQKRELAFETLEWTDSFSDGTEDDGETVTRNEEERAVMKALGSLPEQYQQVIVLAFFEGLSHSKIATRLAEPLGSVKTRIRKAMGELRILLDGKF